MDCYGTVEPIDIKAMEGVFKRVINDSNVRVQGVHWAALINAYGCVLKDFDKAMEIFNSIADHPSTKASGAHLPDSVTFESLINVLVTHTIFCELSSTLGPNPSATVLNDLIRYSSRG